MERPSVIKTEVKGVPSAIMGRSKDAQQGSFMEFYSKPTREPGWKLSAENLEKWRHLVSENPVPGPTFVCEISN